MKLPNKQSELLRLAIADARKCQADPNYILTMVQWHAKIGEHCHVCLAGAVVAKTLNSASYLCRCPGDFDPDTNEKLKIIDYLRRGIWSGLDDAQSSKLDTAASRAAAVSEIPQSADFAAHEAFAAALEEEEL